MAELKQIFQSGKMNRDLDDRLIPNGEYREALNVNVGRSEGSDVGAIENILGNEIIANGRAILNGTTIGSYRDNGNERIYYFVTNNTSNIQANAGQHAIFEYDQITNNINILATGSWLNFHTSFRISGINLVDSLLFWTDNRNQPRKINVDRARADSMFYSSDRVAAVAKYAPFTAPTITTIPLVDPLPGELRLNFLQDKWVRFAYRYKFNDGEYSTISPFTINCFRNTDTTHSAVDAVASGELVGFLNEIQSIDLSVPVPSGYGITDVELIYKETRNANIYIIDDSPVGENQASIAFTYNSQDPFRTLPGSQLTRVYDAVPRLAQSQEFAGGRIVYGNYLQNRDLPAIDFTVTTVGAERNQQFPNHSVKSRRTYQVGVILSDEFGRQSPVILSSTGGDTIFVTPQTGGSTDAFQGLVVEFNDATQIPDWAFSYRIVVKQREQEYYNVFTSQVAAGTDGNPSSYRRRGDSINKIPVDTTQGAGGTNAASTESLYPKLSSTGNDITSELIRVSSIDTTGGTFSIEGVNSFVYETEPVISELDIFFETSTGGPIVDLASPVQVSFYNCYLLDIGTGAHIEINRIRAGFNEPTMDVGVRAYVVQENFAEERRFNTLIHSSGLFNSRVGFNQSNQFNEGEGGITLSLDPQDGSIQKLFAEDTQLIIWQEDKVSRSPIDKDFIYSAEGGAVPVTSNSQYLGTIAPYAGEYGISKDPDSFAVYGTRKYFTDKNRGVVMRLSNDGLTEISKVGMNDFFRDTLRTSTVIIGSFDEYHDTYNLTIKGEGYTASTDTNIATASDGYFTISFEEDVAGWSSFKSFPQESGTTLNNTYYTFSGGNLWEHNSSNVNRNTFYGVKTDSILELIFNEGPSNIKEFKTLSYEGTAGWDCEYIMTDLDTIGTDRVLGNLSTASLVVAQSPISTITEATLTGARSITQAQNSTVTWILQSEPINAGFEFRVPLGTLTSNNSLVQINGVIADLTTPTAGTLTDDGRLFWIITYPLGILDVDISITANIAAVNSFVPPVLTITVREDIDNTNISGFRHSFTTEEFAVTPQQEVSYTLIPNDTYYFENASAITQDFGTLVTIPSTVVPVVDGLNLVTTFNIEEPSTVTNEFINITGNVRRFSIVNYANDLIVANLENAVATIDSVSEDRLRFGETSTRTITITPGGMFTFLNSGDINILSTPNTDISGGTVLENDIITFDSTATFTGTAELGTNREYEFTITGAAIPATFIVDSRFTTLNFDADSFSSGAAVVTTVPIVNSNIEWEVVPFTSTQFTAVREAGTNNLVLTIIADNDTGVAISQEVIIRPSGVGGRDLPPITITIIQDA